MESQDRLIVGSLSCSDGEQGGGKNSKKRTRS